MSQLFTRHGLYAAFIAQIVRAASVKFWSTTQTLVLQNGDDCTAITSETHITIFVFIFVSP